jgi:hypothetical protein
LTIAYGRELFNCGQWSAASTLLTAPHFGIGENEMRLRAAGLRAVLWAAESQPETGTLSELAAPSRDPENLENE